MVTMMERAAPTTPPTRLPEQRQSQLPADQPQLPVALLVDLDDTTEPTLRTPLAGHRMISARSVADVEDVISRVQPGPLAMVTVRGNASAAQVIGTLRKAGWQRILALTDEGTEIPQVLAAFQAGAGGLVRLADHGLRAAHPLDAGCRLSRRELEVVRLVARGLSNKAIGEQLSLSALTVKNHLARVGRKLGTGDRAHIVAIACRSGMIGTDL